eukprot:s10_g56.t2
MAVRTFGRNLATEKSTEGTFAAPARWRSPMFHVSRCYRHGPDRVDGWTDVLVGEILNCEWIPVIPETHRSSKELNILSLWLDTKPKNGGLNLVLSGNLGQLGPRTGLIDPPCYEASSAEDRLERGEAVAEVGHQASLPEERLERVESVEEV